MKILNTSFATSSSREPWKSGTINFIQDAIQSGDEWNAISIIEQNTGNTYNSTIPYVIEGLSFSQTSGPTTSTFQQGVVLYNGILYNTPTFTAVSSGPFYATFSVYNDPTLDATVFSNGANHNIHNDTSINITTTATGAVFNCASFSYMTSVPDQISNALAATPPILITTGSGAGHYFGTYIQDTFQPIEVKKTGTTVKIEGRCSNTLGDTIVYNDPVFELPVGYLPSRDTYVQIIGSLFNNNATGHQFSYALISASTGIVTILGTNSQFDNTSAFFNNQFETNW